MGLGGYGVTGEWRLHNEGLNDLYSLNTMWWIKSRRMQWMGQGEVHRGFWWENPRERDHLEVPDMGGRIILKWICKKWEWEGGARTFWI